jgi:hypothetical protein
MCPTFTSHRWYTFLTLFLNICVLRREVPIAPSGNWSQRRSCLQRNISQHLFIFSWILFSYSDQLYSGSMAPVTCSLYLSMPFHRYTLCRVHTSLLSLGSQTGVPVRWANLADLFCTWSKACIWHSLYGYQHPAPYTRMGCASDV